MLTKSKSKRIEKLLFEVYTKGVKNQDCNLTEVIVRINEVYESKK